jgi:hypothetical protein
LYLLFVLYCLEALMGFNRWILNIVDIMFA